MTYHPKKLSYAKMLKLERQRRARRAKMLKLERQRRARRARHRRRRQRRETCQFYAFLREHGATEKLIRAIQRKNRRGELGLPFPGSLW